MAVAHRASIAANETTGATGFTITIPASVASGDDCYVTVTSGSHDAVTAFPTVTDNDTGGNTWSRIAESTDRKGTLWHKKATSATASKTVTVAGCVNSASGGISCYSGGHATSPHTDIVVEDNASGDEGHAGFTPTAADSIIAISIFNFGSNADVTVTSVACTDPATLSQRFENLSSGGTDCANTLWSGGPQSGGPNATGNFSWAQANRESKSIAWAIRPAAGTPINASGTSDLNFASDSLAAFRPMFAGLTDDALNLADSLAISVTSARQGWSDALAFDLAELGATTPINASLGPDALGLGTDALAASMPMLADFPDSAANLDDALAGLAALLANLAADSAANLNDALASAHALFAALSDSAANLNDPQPRLIEDHFLSIPDDLNAWGDGIAADLTEGFAALTANLTDSAANLADSLAGLEDLRAALADDAANLNDALTYIQGLLADLSDSAANLLDILEAFESMRADLSDDATNLADSLGAVVSGFGELLISLPIDSMANAVDSIAGFMDLAARVADDAANLNDLLELIKAHYLLLSDDTNQWGDSSAFSLSSFIALLADLPADSMALADALTVLHGLRANLSDDSNNLSDALALFAALLVSMPDDAANLNDLLAAFVSQFGELLVALPPDQMGNLADSIGGARQLFANLAADDAANLADSLASLHALIAGLPADAMGNLADALAVITSGFLDLLISLPADQMGNLADAVSRVEGLLIALGSDDAANLADNFDALHGLIVALSDDGANLTDALGPFLDLYANPSADPYALADALVIFVGGLELIGTVTLSNALAHSLTVTETRVGGSITVTEAPADA